MSTQGNTIETVTENGVTVEVRSYPAADGSTTWIAGRFCTGDRDFSIYLATR